MGCPCRRIREVVAYPAGQRPSLQEGPARHAVLRVLERHATFNDGAFVPKLPPHRLDGGIYYRDLNRFARLFLLHAYAQNEFAALDTATPGYNLLNAELRYTFRLDQPEQRCRR